MKSFSSKIGVLLAAAGSAVGLGSIWKFPYIVGEDGGGAFIILYIACSIIFGLPLVMTEFLIGKLSRKSVYGAFRTIEGSNRWQWLSWTSLMSAVLILTFYFVVTGWCIYYMVQAASNTFASMDAAALTTFFNTFEGNAPTMIWYAIIAIMGHNLFENANDFVTNFMIPLGAFGVAMYTGWFVPQARYQGPRVASAIYLVLLRWVIPVAIIIVVLDSLNLL